MTTTTVHLTLGRTARQSGSKTAKMKWPSWKGSILSMLRKCPVTLIRVSDDPSTPSLAENLYHYIRDKQDLLPNSTENKQHFLLHFLTKFNI